MNFFATTPKGLELLLVEELRTLGAGNPKEKLAGVTFSGDLSVAYKACLWSRLANRILLPLAEFPAKTPEELYLGVKNIKWDEHLSPSGTLWVNCVSSHSAISHTLFAAQKIKDAIVDQCREKFDVRPSVTNEQPDICLHAYLHRDIATLSLDLSGESLHKRGFRLETGSAPLKENLAAALLLRAEWPSIAKTQGYLIDPMCGSGTLLLEAALLAGDIAPGLMRDYFGFLKWRQHQKELWTLLLEDAKQRREIGLQKIPPIIGFDRDAEAIKIAHSNIARAELNNYIHVEKRDLTIPFTKQGVVPGLVITNPPYGERLGEMASLKTLYQSLGEKLKQEFLHWQAAVFTGNPELGKCMGLRAKKYYAFYNGVIPCQLLLFAVEPEKFVDQSVGADNERRIRRAQKVLAAGDNAAIQMFVNRLQKKLKHIRKQLPVKEGKQVRIYDADLPEYAVAIDLYFDRVEVTEYQAPKSISKMVAEERMQHVLAVLPDTLQIEPAKIFYQLLPRY